MMNKTSCQNILENFKARQDHKILSQKKVKDEVLNNANALLKGRELIFKAFESGIRSKPECFKDCQ